MPGPSIIRITAVIYGELSTLSGGYLYDRVLLHHLRRRGDSVRVVSLHPGRYGRHLLDNLAGKLVDAIVASAPDLILEDELCHPSLIGVNRRLKRRLPTAPIVALVHHLSSDEAHPPVPKAGLRLVERAYLRTVDAILANTTVTRDRVEAVSGRRLPSAVALPGSTLPGAPPTLAEIEQRLTQRSGPLRVLFVGNLHQRKRPDVLLEAVRQLNATGVAVHLTMVGGDHLEPDYARQLHDQAATLLDGERVRFTGPRTGADLATLYGQHDVLAVPSSYEGFGMVYLEGMAYGLPALGAKDGGAREIIEDGVNGWLIPTGDSSYLADRLGSLASSSPQLRTMSLAAQASYDAHPRWAESMDGAWRFLHRIAI